jgi:hypothetical protein
MKFYMHLNEPLRIKTILDLILPLYNFLAGSFESNLWCRRNQFYAEAQKTDIIRLICIQWVLNIKEKR